MKINIITSPFGYLPPQGIGAIEKRWYYVGYEFGKMGNQVRFYAKKCDCPVVSSENVEISYVSGFERKKSIYTCIFLDFIYTFKVLCKMKKTDILVMNTFSAPMIAPLLFHFKYKKSVFNVARFPKIHFILYRLTDFFCCVSSATRNGLITRFPYYKNNSNVISNPIQTNIFCSKNFKNTKKIPFLICYHGRIHQEKGLDLLVGALNKLIADYPLVKLRLIGAWQISKGGSGDQYLASLKKAARFPVEIIPPISSPEDLARLLAESHIYCYPSIAEKGETFGVSPLEAMGVGLPTVVSSLGCFQDFVVPSENGLVFDHRNKDAVSDLEKSLRLYLQSAELQERISKQAAKDAAMFSVKNIAQKYITCFKKLLEEK